jgi:hypothetical protein
VGRRTIVDVALKGRRLRETKALRRHALAHARHRAPGVSKTFEIQATNASGTTIPLIASFTI